MSDAQWWDTFEAQPLQHPRDPRNEPSAYQFEAVYFVNAPTITRRPVPFQTVRAVVEIRNQRPHIVFFDILWNHHTNWATVLYLDTHLAPNRGG
jgi:hypothetical protein